MASLKEPFEAPVFLEVQDADLSVELTKGLFTPAVNVHFWLSDYVIWF